MLTADELAAHRAARLRRLEGEVRHLRAERKRLELLLGHALRIAVGGTDVSPWALLDVIAELAGTDLARPAWVEERERAAHVQEAAA